MEGVATVEVTRRTKEVRVSYDPRMVTEERLRAVIAAVNATFEAGNAANGPSELLR